MANGNKYEGEWRNGLRNGYGTFYWLTGQVYKGQWLDDHMHGNGQFIDENGLIKQVIMNLGQQVGNQ